MASGSCVPTLSLCEKQMFFFWRAVMFSVMAAEGEGVASNGNGNANGPAVLPALGSI